MKDIIKQAIIDTDFYNKMEKSESGVLLSFENLNLSKTENLYLRKYHNLTPDDEFLLVFNNEKQTEGDFFTASRTYRYSLIFLEDRIKYFKRVETTGWDKEEDFFDEIPYNAIESVEVFQSFVRFFFYGADEPYDLGVYFFGIDKLNYKDPIEPLFSKIKEGIDSLEDNYEKSKEDYKQLINEAFEAEDYQKAYNILEEYSFLEDYFFFKYDLAFTFSMLDADAKAIEVLDELIESAEKQEENYWGNKAKMFKSTFLEDKGNYYEALQLFNEGLKNYEYKESSGYYSEERSQELYSQYIENFKNLSYKDRKVIYITNNNEKFKSDTLTVLQANQLPDIVFPSHHPINNETYIGHPYNNDLYISIHNYDNELLIDRINELCYLLQCLGAESITIENTSSEDNSNRTNQQTDTNVGISTLKAGVEVDNKSTQNRSSENQISQRIGKAQTFQPTKYPYVPKDLVWFPNEASWQRLVKQRMEGSMLEHNEYISSSQSQILNSNEINDLKVDLKLFFNKANINVKKDLDTEIKNNSSTEWSVQVKFKPIEQFDKQTVFIEEETTAYEELPPADTNETEFIEEYKFLISDGELSERDERILNRMREKLNISEERAVYLINSLNSYSEEEQELIDEIKLMLADGEISEREQRILIRFANRLNISENRCLEIIEEIINE